jgi:hypothetical protein
MSRMGRGASKPSSIPVYLEVGSKRVFAGALEWPGWARAGRDEDAALEALLAYGARYASVLPKELGFSVPADRSAFEVAERLEGNATTDFGAPGIVPAADQRPVNDDELARLVALLQASWDAFDRAARAAAGAELRKGPRGGGRDLDRIVSHVMGADQGYLRSLGGSFEGSGDEDPDGLRSAILGTLDARGHGDPGRQGKRRSPPWPPHYFVRRSAWHALDHAWEIEDRASPSEA